MTEDRASRLREARIDAGYGKAAKAAKAFNWTVPTYTAHENGWRQFDYDQAIKYAEAYGISPTWLWKGTGPKKGSAARVTDVAVNVYDSGAMQVIPIPVFNVVVSGGHGANHAQPEIIEHLPMPRELIRMYTGAPAEKLAFVRVMGESMIPDYHPGELVLVDRTQKRGSSGYPYVIAEDDFLVIKYLEITADAPPKLRLISKNPAFPAVEKHAEDVYIVGRVIGKWSWT